MTPGHRPAPDAPGTAGPVPQARIVGYVAAEPVRESLVATRLAELARGPGAGSLPRTGVEYRQLRRWVAQLVVTEVLCRSLAGRAGLPPVAEPLAITDVAAMELGSVYAAVLAASPYARAVYLDLLAGCEIPEADVVDFHRRNGDLFRTPDALAAGTDAVRPYGEVRTGIRERLRAAATRRRFREYLNRQAALTVTLCPGWEHPGDPAQPDNTHRH